MPHLLGEGTDAGADQDREAGAGHVLHRHAPRHRLGTRAPPFCQPPAVHPHHRQRDAPRGPGVGRNWQDRHTGALRLGAPRAGHRRQGARRLEHHTGAGAGQGDSRAAQHRVPRRAAPGLLAEEDVQPAAVDHLARHVPCQREADGRRHPEDRHRLERADRPLERLHLAPRLPDTRWRLVSSTLDGRGKAVPHARRRLQGGGCEGDCPQPAAADTQRGAQPAAAVRTALPPAARRDLHSAKGLARHAATGAGGIEGRAVHAVDIGLPLGQPPHRRAHRPEGTGHQPA